MTKGRQLPHRYQCLLEIGAKFKQNAKIIKTISDHVPNVGYTILMGDFNFVENKYNDTASHSTFPARGSPTHPYLY